MKTMLIKETQTNVHKKPMRMSLSVTKSVKRCKKSVKKSVGQFNINECKERKKKYKVTAGRRLT